MKLLREMLIIVFIYFLGEFISKSFIHSVPGNIIGMLILLVLLCTKVVKVEAIDCVAQFFLDHLAFFFVPAGVGLMTSVGLLEGNILKLLFICCNRSYRFSCSSFNKKKRKKTTRR